MKWDRDEIKNQLIHLLIGTLCMAFIKVWIALPLIAAVVLVVIIETIPYYFFDNKELKILDRIRDGLFYIIIPLIGLIIGLIIK